MNCHFKKMHALLFYNISQLNPMFLNPIQEAGFVIIISILAVQLCAHRFTAFLDGQAL